jgi:hypothetical protein
MVGNSSASMAPAIDSDGTSSRERSLSSNFFFDLTRQPINQSIDPSDQRGARLNLRRMEQLVWRLYMGLACLAK